MPIDVEDDENLEHLFSALSVNIERMIARRSGAFVSVRVNDFETQLLKELV